MQSLQGWWREVSSVRTPSPTLLQAVCSVALLGRWEWENTESGKRCLEPCKILRPGTTQEKNKLPQHLPPWLHSWGWGNSPGQEQDWRIPPNGDVSSPSYCKVSWSSQACSLLIGRTWNLCKVALHWNRILYHLSVYSLARNLWRRKYMREFQKSKVRRAAPLH